MTHDGEPCAAVPLTQISVAAWYCHVHQAWCWTAMSFDQTAEEALHVRHSASGDFGPFDGVHEVLTKLFAQLHHMATTVTEAAI